MKLHSTFFIAVLGLGVVAPACVQAQQAPAGIAGGKTAPGTPGKGKTQKQRVALPVARTGTVTPAAQTTTRSGVATNVLSTGTRSDHQNDGGKGPPNDPPSNDRVSRLASAAGLAGKSEDKAPPEPKDPKAPEPKDPKGPDKLPASISNVALPTETMDAASPHAVRQATQVRSVDAAQQAANSARLQGTP